MNKKNWLKVFVLLIVFAIGFTAFWYAKNNRAGWQNQVIPGKLSAAHASLETNCAACHTAVQGVDEAKCIACHANNESLLQRQPTAFHASISNCASCHVEHQGINANLRVMNHEALAQIGINIMPDGMTFPLNQTTQFCRKIIRSLRRSKRVLTARLVTAQKTNISDFWVKTALRVTRQPSGRFQSFSIRRRARPIAPSVIKLRRATI